MSNLSLLTRLVLNSESVPTPFWPKLGNCLVWTGTRFPKGYGQLSIEGKTSSVHRAAWELQMGPIPEVTPWVLHKCDNPPCWRIEHLFLGTSQTNFSDMIAKNRSPRAGIKLAYCLRGHDYSLTENIYESPDGTQRRCRACDRERARKYRAEKRQTLF